MAMPKLLVITPDDVLAMAYRARLARVGFEVERRATGREGLFKARHWCPDVIVLDLTLPGMRGLDVLKSLRDVPWLVRVPAVLLVERAMERDLLEQCLLWGAHSVLHKDTCSVQEFVAHLQTVVPSSPTPSS